MAKIDRTTLRSMLAGEKANALAAMSAAQLMQERADANNYYMGRMEGDMPAPDGRSATVSLDVADTIEGLMPQLMDIFCGSDEVVRFEPVGPEDEEAAQQETDYVNHVFMQMNDGFVTLYDFAKDGLLSKVGLVKIWWEERDKEERETYYDLSEEQYMMLMMAVAQSEGAMEVVEHTVNGEPEANEPEEAAS